MNEIKLLFFGSTSDSVIILSHLFDVRITDYRLRISCVVTQPPKPVGRQLVITPTPVEIWAKQHDIPVVSFASSAGNPSLYEREELVADTLAPFKADLLVSASYGQRIPMARINEARFGGLNVHPSILPRWRGADPVPWAILSGDHQIGVTVVTLSEKFDEGKIIAVKKVPMTEKDSSDPLRTHLFELGGELLKGALADYLSGKNKGTAQATGDNTPPPPYSRKFVRDDGFFPWEFLQMLIKGEINPNKSRPQVFAKLTIDNYQAATVRALRALSPWPGIWTKITIQREQRNDKTTKQQNDKVTTQQNDMLEKRLKILACHLEPTTHNLILDSVQLEGKKPVSYDQFTQAYLKGTQAS